MSVTDTGNDTLSRASHHANVCFARRPTPSGIATSRSDVHSLNAPSSILTSEEGKTISRRFEHPKKAYSPISRSEEGRANSTRIISSRSAKASDSMTFVPAGTVSTESFTSNVAACDKMRELHSAEAMVRYLIRHTGITYYSTGRNVSGWRSGGSMSRSLTESTRVTIISVSPRHGIAV